MPSITALPSNPVILALDTSSSLGSVALSRGSTLLANQAFQSDHSHSQRLLPAVEAVFAGASLGIEAVDLFAVVVGPGSFTGLRVSLASIRGLAGDKPCFGALATDVSAWAARERGEGSILALTDLFHGEVFGSVHDAQGALISSRESGDLSQVMATFGTLVNGSSLAVGSATVKRRADIEASFPGITFVDLDEGLAPHLISLAAVRASGETISTASDLLPFYLRDPLTRGLLNTQPRTQ